jgi:hypothetical protein
MGLKEKKSYTEDEKVSKTGDGNAVVILKYNSSSNQRLGLRDLSPHDNSHAFLEFFPLPPLPNHVSFLQYCQIAIAITLRICSLDF